MAIDRKIQKVFGGSLSPSGNIAVYGSKKAGSPTFSDNVETLQSTSWLQGIMGATSTDKAPYVQDLNSIFYVITKQLAYLFQSGVAEWDSQTEYFANKSICQHNGLVYSCIADNTNKEPGATGWESYWISFDFATDIIPTGTIVPFASTTVPSGWFLTNGLAVSRSTYSKLFSVIGTTFGAGDGSTTFNLPDFTNRTFWYDTTIGNKDSSIPNHFHGVGTNNDNNAGQFLASYANSWSPTRITVTTKSSGGVKGWNGSGADTGHWVGSLDHVGYEANLVTSLVYQEANTSNGGGVYSNSETYVRPQSIGIPFIIKY